MRNSFLNFFLNNALFPSLAFIFVISFYISARQLEPISFNYPKGVITILIVLFIWTIFSEGKKWYQRKEEWAEGETTLLLSKVKEFKKPLLMMVTLLVYILLFDIIGFYVSTGLLLLLLFIILGQHRPKIILLNLIGLLLLCYVLFTAILNLPLPSGMFI
jgi:putative tricarboxylic transport membrane protein